MNETDELLENIRKFEADNQNASWSTSTVFRTAAIKMTINIDKQLESKTFKPDKIGLSIIVLIAFAIGAAATIELIKTEPVAGYILGPFILGAVIYSYLNNIVFNKRLNYIITLSKDGIAYDDTFYKWANIKETAYLVLPIGKNTKTFLVLLFNDNGHDTWQLTNFRSFFPDFTTKLASYIEHFRS